jgi:ABC-type Mn2+/Zn2+ transport system ATPase subunit
MFVRPADHDEGAPALELENVNVNYGGMPALEQISLRVERGDQVAVVGPNGAGKSTLFNVIVGIVQPSRGQVHVYGSGPTAHICVGYVPQRNRIDWSFPATVTDVVMMGRVGRMGLFRWPSRRDRQLVAECLERVGMSEHSQRQIGELSGGQQQRTFLARAFAQEAELLLLDEPLTGLDIPSQNAIAAILANLQQRGITVMVATHDLNQAAQRFPKMMMLNRRVIAYGPPAEVLSAETLAAAYGNQVHVIHGANGDFFMTDTACSGGHPPVHPLLGSDPAGPTLPAGQSDSLTEPD